MPELATGAPQRDIGGIGGDKTAGHARRSGAELCSTLEAKWKGKVECFGPAEVEAAGLRYVRIQEAETAHRFAGANEMPENWVIVSEDQPI